MLRKLLLAPLDPPPFAWLDGAVSPGALYIALLILTTQRRQAEGVPRILIGCSQRNLMISLANPIQLMQRARGSSPIFDAGECSSAERGRFLKVGLAILKPAPVDSSDTWRRSGMPRVVCGGMCNTLTGYRWALWMTRRLACWPYRRMG